MFEVFEGFTFTLKQLQAFPGIHLGQIDFFEHTELLIARITGQPGGGKAALAQFFFDLIILFFHGEWPIALILPCSVWLEL